jgi:DNA/RNA-binding domain of Phe-tRNA-synthetase-like protein
MLELTLEPHPRLCAAAFVCEFPRPLGEMESSAEVLALHSASAPAPVQRSEELRGAIRDLLRHGGYKPTGRGKPSSEYLARAAEEGGLPRINLSVDACNAVSLHSGLPVSVVDLDLAKAPYRLALGGADASYVFNASGQTIDIGGLLCLFDADGACANAVKDAQRTKTHVATRRTLSVLWGAKGFEAQVEAAAKWYRELLERAGATTQAVELRSVG